MVVQNRPKDEKVSALITDASLSNGSVLINITSDRIREQYVPENCGSALGNTMLMATSKTDVMAAAIQNIALQPSHAPIKPLNDLDNRMPINKPLITVPMIFPLF